MEGIDTKINRPSCVHDSPNANIMQLSTLFPPIGIVVCTSSTFEMSTMERLKHIDTCYLIALRFSRTLSEYYLISLKSTLTSLSNY